MDSMLKTYLVLPNFRMNKSEAPDAWTGREVTVLRTSGADALVEVVLSEDRMVAGQEVWLPKTRLDGYEEPVFVPPPRAGRAWIEATTRATAARLVEPVGDCDGSREFYYDGRAEDGRGARRPSRCLGCRACS